MENWIGAVAAVLTTVAFVPQALKVIRERDTRALSLGMYVLFTAGVALWFVYGLMIRSVPVCAANGITGVLSAIILVLKLRHG